MPKPHFVVWMFMGGLMILGASVVSGQDYPSKSIRIVTAGVGTGVDFVARVMAQGLSVPLNQEVIVDNRPAGVIPGQVVSQALPDGHTLLAIGNGFWIAPFLQVTPYDPVRDFAPITLLVSSPSILAVHPSLPVKSVKELIALAKANPGALNYASGGAGGASHLSVELFKYMAGVNITRIPYSANSQQATDLISNQVQMTIDSMTSVAPQIKAGKLRALAVTSAQPTALAPGLPTVAASGLPGYEFRGLNALFAPARTPAAVINRLHSESVRVLNMVDVKEKLFNLTLEVVGSSPEELAITLKSDMASMGKLIKDAGIKVE